MQRSAAFGKRGASQHGPGRSAAAPRRKSALATAAPQPLPTYQELLALENPDAVPAPDPRMAFEPRSAEPQQAAVAAGRPTARSAGRGGKAGGPVLGALAATVLFALGSYAYYYFTDRFLLNTIIPAALCFLWLIWEIAKSAWNSLE